MTSTLEYVFMFIGFAMWFWVGYRIGRNEERKRSQRKRIFNTESERKRRAEQLADFLNKNIP